MNIINSGKLEADLADAVVMRTHEVYAYDLNIGNYLAITSLVIGEWPQHLQTLRGLPPQEAAELCPIDDLDDLAELQQFDRATYLLKTEKLERAKSNALLSVAISRLSSMSTPEEFEVFIDAATQRWNTASSINTPA